MGEEFNPSVLMFCSNDEAVPQPIMNLSDVPTFLPEDTEETEFPISFTRNMEATYTLKSCTLNRHFKKIVYGFGNCSGPPRIRALQNYIKKHKRQQRFMSRTINALFEVNNPLDRELSIDISGLPCTDFYEWVWMQFGDESYEEYRMAKLARTGRARRRRKNRNCNTLC